MAWSGRASARALLWLHIFAVLRLACEHVGALEFRVPKPGRSYDTSEMVFIFERDAIEDGYPVLEVDGMVVRSFDFKAMEYEISMMGQQVGQHHAVVRLMEVTPFACTRRTRSCILTHVLDPTVQLPEGDEEVAAGNRELANASVSYSIADPGSGINYMRSSLGDGDADHGASISESLERGQVFLCHAMFILRFLGAALRCVLDVHPFYAC